MNATRVIDGGKKKKGKREGGGETRVVTGR